VVKWDELEVRRDHDAYSMMRSRLLIARGALEGFEGIRESGDLIDSATTGLMSGSWISVLLCDAYLR